MNNHRIVAVAEKLADIIDKAAANYLNRGLEAPWYLTVEGRRSVVYQKFLTTMYWWNVKKLVLCRDDRKCQDCGARFHLEVHHESYEHRGDELNHLGDLVTLCDRCHALRHGIFDTALGNGIGMLLLIGKYPE